MNHMDRIHREYRDSEWNAADDERRAAFYALDWAQAHEENEIRSVPELEFNYDFVNNLKGD